jgi:PHD/YefM family antitoxin component YafN of YafNO toxin-antitoxin module
LLKAGGSVIIELDAYSMLSKGRPMMIDLREIRSVTEFQRHVKGYIGRLTRKKTPLVLTVNGRAALVVQDSESYQLMLERLEHIETVDAIKQGMDEFARGKGVPARAALGKLLAKHGLSR